SPSILTATPEAAANGGLAILKTGDKVRIDLDKGSANILISEVELKKRHADLKAKGGFPYPANQTPWQELYRNTVGQQATGACMEFATRYHDIAGKVGVARDNHYPLSSLPGLTRQSILLQKKMDTRVKPAY